MAKNNGGVGVSFYVDNAKGFLNHVSKMSKASKGLAERLGPGMKKTGTGMRKALGGMTERLGGMKGMFGGLGGMASKAGGQVGKGLGFMMTKLNPTTLLLGGLSDAMMSFVGNMPTPGSIANAFSGLGDVGELTSNLEGEFVGLSTETRRLGANMGYTGKKLDAFTSKTASTAMALNVGADEAAKAARAWDEAGDSLTAMGFKSEKQLLKFTSAFGVNADSLRNAGLRMQNEFKLTDEQISNVIGSTFEMGKATGDVASAMQTLPSVMDKMRDQAAMMGVEMDGAKLSQFAASANALATGLFQVGQSSEQSVEAAGELTQALLDADRNFKNMFAGTQNELDDFTKEMAITTGDVEQAFELMKQGPAGFVSGMASMVADAKKAGTLTDQNLSFIGARLEKVLGKEASARLVNTFRAGDEAMIRSMATTQKATAALGKAGNEAFRTGRTMQENFDRMMDSVGDAFRKSGKKDVREWAKRTRAGVKEAKKSIAELGASDGPLGTFVRGLSTATHLGAQAFLPPSLQTAGLVMGAMVKKIAPLNEQMKALGINFTSVGGILTGVTVGIGLFAAKVALAKRENNSWSDAIRESADALATDLVLTVEKWGGMLQEIAAEFANFNWSDLWKGANEAVSSEESGPIGRIVQAFQSIPWREKVFPNLQKGWDALWAELEDSGTLKSVEQSLDNVMQNVVLPAMSQVSDFLLEAIMKVPWGKIGGAIASGMAGAALEAVNPLAAGGLFGFGAREDKRDKWAEDMAAARKKTAKADLRRGGATEAEISGGVSLPKEIKQASVAVSSFQTQSVAAGEVVSASMSQAEDAFMSLHSTIKEESSGSIHTYVGEDMDKTVEAVAGAMQQIEQLFYDAWFRIGEGAVLATGVIDSSGVMRKLALLTQAQDQLNTAKRDVPSVQVDTQRDLKIREATGDQAIHNPEWYRGSKGFEALFTRKMDRLIATVAAGGATSGNANESKALLDAIKARKPAGGRPLMSRDGGGINGPGGPQGGR